MDGMPRDADTSSSLPAIPVQPLSPNDGRILLQHLTGPDAPKDWVGGLNLEYRLGALDAAEPGLVVHVRLSLKTTQSTIWNVIGVCLCPSLCVGLCFWASIYF